MQRLSLSQRLFLIIILALLPTVAVVAFNLYTLRQVQERELHAEAARIGELVSLEMDQIVTGTESLLRTIASAPIVNGPDSAACTDYLATLVRELPQYVSIAVIDASGRIRCAPETLEEEVFVTDRSYFVEALASERRVVGEFTEGRLTSRRSLPIAVRMAGGGNRPPGVVVAGLDLAWLGESIRGRTLAPGGAVTIADRNGRILAREPLPEDFVGTTIPEGFQHLVRAAAPGTLELTSQDGTRRVIGYYPATTTPEGVYVSAGLATARAYAALNLAALRGLAVALASVVVAFLVARATSETFINRPFRRMADTIERWRRDDMTARTGMGAREGELGALGQAIDGFMDDLVATRLQRRRSEQQRDLLSAELDHRVKNLLATVQAVARQTFRGSDPGEAVSEFMNRLATMSNAHTLLMKDEWQEASFTELITGAVAPFDTAHGSRFTLEGPQLTFNSRAILALGMALHELCTNAVKYGALRHGEGRVDVRWEVARGVEPEGEEFRLVWRERGGPPVAPPTRTGFGSRMIEQVLAQQIGGQASVAYPVGGVVCTITAPLSVIEPSQAAAE